MDNKGKLLVTTKAPQRKKIIVGIGSVYMLVIAILIVVLLLTGRGGKIGKEYFNNAVMGDVLGLIIAVILFKISSSLLLRYQSYCEIYENSIVGMTVSSLSIIHSNIPKKFDINYNEILNVTESGDGATISIYTQYETFEILAMANREKAVNEIKARIKKNNKPF